MTDQAESLRQLATQVAARDPGHEQGGVIGVVGTQPSVGTTTVAVNMAISLARQGWPIALVDADFERPSADRNLGLLPRRPWSEFLVGRKSIREMLQPGPAGLSVLTGLQVEPHDDDTRHKATQRLQEQLVPLAESRLVIVDLGRQRDEFDLFSVIDDVIVVTTPQTDCVMAGYATIKQTASKPTRAGFWLVINQTVDVSEAKQALQRVALSCDRFLNLSLHMPNTLPLDLSATEAERAERPLILHAPSSPLSVAVDELATEYTGVRRAFGRAIPAGI